MRSPPSHPLALNIDMIENKAAVMEFLERVNQVRFYVYDYYFERLHSGRPFAPG